MRAVVALCLLASACAANVDWASLETRDHHLVALQTAQESPKESFLSWMLHHGKDYLEDVQEFEHRMAIWLDNMAYAVQYNKEHSKHWLGMNSPADRSHAEYKRHFLGYRPDLKMGLQTSATPGFRHSNVTAKASIDWREKGAVTAVKNQEQCGSCWAFSTTGSVEGANAIYSGKLVSLSEQELVDCDLSRDHGCQGGLMDFAYYFIIQNGGIDTEKDYAYNAVQGQCNINKEDRHVVTIDSYEDVPPQDEGALEKAVSEQPVSVAIQADERAFQLYSGGVFDTECGTALDHGVLAVGYGKEKGENGEDYWIVKNSWGSWWGDQGYIRLVKGLKDSAAGQCGIAMQPSYPVKTSPNPPPPTPKPPGPPAPPKPQPNVCDTSTECPAGSTCCCESEFFGYCFTWACCPLENAVCCDDHTHCCPHDLPVCDITAGRCTKGPAVFGKSASLDDSVPLFVKQPAMTTLSGRTMNPVWKKEKAEKEGRYEQS